MFNSFTTDQIYEIGKSVTLGELCLLRLKIIKNPLWDESAQSNFSSEY